jgi:hypothetical protein
VKHFRVFVNEKRLFSAEIRFLSDIADQSTWLPQNSENSLTSSLSPIMILTVSRVLLEAHQ